MSDEQLAETVRNHDVLLLGDPKNPRERPGLVHEFDLLVKEQKTTNEILQSLRSELKRMVRLVLGAFVTALLAMVFRGAGNLPFWP